MNDDPYTLEMQLCDSTGMVSNERRADWKPGQSETYLQLMNNLSRMTKLARDPEVPPTPVTQPFQCTGSAHLIGEHIRCTSPAHRA